MKKSKVALIVIYNHRYDNNIEIVEKIYEKKFDNIYHLVPFYDGVKKNVIPVYENSYYFQGYVAQGFKSYFNDEYTHYFFIADDMILNPAINQNNYLDSFLLTEDMSFVPWLKALPAKGFWSHNLDALLYKTNVPGLEIKKYLPSYREALNIINSKEIYTGSFSFKNVYGKYSFKAVAKFLIYSILNKVSLRKGLKYPMVYSYSDIFIISSKTIDKFVKYCGIFAASNLFVELAIPTALILSSSLIRTEDELSFSGKALWNEQDYKILNPFNEDLISLLNNFPVNHIYLHPIKLSKWKTKGI